MPEELSLAFLPELIWWLQIHLVFLHLRMSLSSLFLKIIFAGYRIWHWQSFLPPSTFEKPSTISDEKFIVIQTVIFICHASFLSDYFQDFFLCLWFQQSNYDVSGCGFLWAYPALSSLLTLFFTKFWVFSAIHCLSFSLRYNWHVLVSDVQHNDLLFVYVANWSP